MSLGRPVLYLFNYACLHGLTLVSTVRIELFDTGCHLIDGLFREQTFHDQTGR